MISQEHALSTADAWLNSDSNGARREVRHREFDLGWVVWAAPAPLERDPVTGARRPPADLGDACGVINRHTGALTVWSSIPVDEVIDTYREHHRPRVGPGNTLTATHTAGSEPATIHLTGTPGHPPVEHQLVAELARRAIPTDAVTAVHTALRPATLPGNYGAALLQQHFPSATITFDHPYGITAAERAEGTTALAGRTPHHRTPAPQPDTVTPAEPVRDVALGRQLPTVFGEVTRYDADDLAATNLPDSTRSTLTWAGLPAEVPLFFTADRPDAPPAGGLFPDLRTHLQATDSTLEATTLDALANWTRIGTDGHCTIAVQNTGNEAGSVWAIHPRTGSGRFVNTDVSTFARSLAQLTTTRPTLTDLDPTEAATVLTTLQTTLAQIDPQTFRKDTTWWSTLIEQMWHGLL
ncbi:SUKH-4 family immunity protein [Kitasatospora sp. NPDC002040]|uniref:SUKH-4 family immunity protein n=1 Tax=Kitasatospora sp. NPDC002040 TaxID=3154661 RepID=UPI0033320FB8